VQHSDTAEAEAAAAALLIRSEILRASVTNAAAVHRSFFQWLLGCVRDHNAGQGINCAAAPILTPHDMTIISSFLDTYFLRDALSQQAQVGCPLQSLPLHATG
jgi:hypothetical protein